VIEMQARARIQSGEDTGEVWEKDFELLEVEH
jgi:hypothetical protein